MVERIRRKTAIQCAYLNGWVSRMSGEIRRLAMWPEKGLGEEKEGGKEHVANDRISEEQVGRGEAGVSYGKGLDPAGQGLRVELYGQRDGRVEIPVDRVGDQIEEERGENGGEKKWQCSVLMVITQADAERENDPETKIPGDHPGIE